MKSLRDKDSLSNYDTIRWRWPMVVANGGGLDGVIQYCFSLIINNGQHVRHWNQTDNRISHIKVFFFHCSSIIGWNVRVCAQRAARSGRVKAMDTPNRLRARGRPTIISNS